MLRILANQATVSIQNMQLYEMAALDPAHRRVCASLLRAVAPARSAARGARTSPSPSCSSISTSSKRINDSAGHLAGDQALAMMGKVPPGHARERYRGPLRRRRVRRHPPRMAPPTTRSTRAGASSSAWPTRPSRAPAAHRLRSSAGVSELLAPRAPPWTGNRRPSSYFQDIAQGLIRAAMRRSTRPAIGRGRPVAAPRPRGIAGGSARARRHDLVLAGAPREPRRRGAAPRGPRLPLRSEMWKRIAKMARRAAIRLRAPDQRPVLIERDLVPVDERGLGGIERVVVALVERDLVARLVEARLDLARIGARREGASAGAERHLHVVIGAALRDGPERSAQVRAADVGVVAVELEVAHALAGEIVPDREAAERDAGGTLRSRSGSAWLHLLVVHRRVGRSDTRGGAPLSEPPGRAARRRAAAAGRRSAARSTSCCWKTKCSSSSSM